ncbi:MAG: lmo0937 family membrane protein [Bacteroidia bacterium]
MKNFNYILSVILIILWVTGFFTHVAGSSVHFLLIGSLILILINVISEDNNGTTEKI